MKVPEYKSFQPKDLPHPTLHNQLLSTIGPRPIALASTIDSQGNVNLSPFSFFNIFSSNPSILIFSPSRRGRDNTLKHTYENLLEVDEVVIHSVSYDIVEQVSLSSTEYHKGVNEFIKAGFTQIDSTVVRPPRVAEAKAAFECKVKQIIETGNNPGAGILVICEIVMVHFHTDIFDERGMISPYKTDLVGRMGNDWYCRANAEALFEVAKPNQKLGIGIDQLPANIRNSEVLTGNELAKLANLENIPDLNELKEKIDKDLVRKVDNLSNSDEMHQLAKKYLLENKVDEAWFVLLNGDVKQ